MDHGTLSGIVTALLILMFIGVIAWAWNGRRRKDFEEAARLPLDEDRPRTNGRDRDEE